MDARQKTKRDTKDEVKDDTKVSSLNRGVANNCDEKDHIQNISGKKDQQFSIGSVRPETSNRFSRGDTEYTCEYMKLDFRKTCRLEIQMETLQNTESLLSVFQKNLNESKTLFKHEPILQNTAFMILFCKQCGKRRAR